MAATIKDSYLGYFRRDEPAPDLELTQVGPGTPGGEYLRRFWHPIAQLSALQDVPMPLRIMGEDLVLFRDGRGEIGLLHRHCAHRGTSLEFGMVERVGLRCCYHGWLYDVDGSVLETPGEPVDSALKDRVVHGAYPVQEYKGLVFTYMGPPDRQPPFIPPSSVECPASGWRAVAKAPWEMIPCNWLQLAENMIDHVHAASLHAPQNARTRLMQYRPTVDTENSLDDYFNRGLPEAYEPVYQQSMARWRTQEKEWQEFPGGVLISQAERHGDYVWLSVGGNVVMPTLVEFAAPRRHGGYGGMTIDEEVAYEPPMLTDWWVPVDDTHTYRVGFNYVAESEETRDLQATETRVNDQGRVSFAKIERAHYQARQWEPSDYEAQQTQREIAIHALEHLGTTDRGILLLRKQLREGIRAIQRGEDPQPGARGQDGSMLCPCRNAAVRIPPAETAEADRTLLRVARQRFVQAILDGEDTIAAVSQVAR